MFSDPNTSGFPSVMALARVGCCSLKSVGWGKKSFQTSSQTFRRKMEVGRRIVLGGQEEMANFGSPLARCPGRYCGACIGPKGAEDPQRAKTRDSDGLKFIYISPFCLNMKPQRTPDEE